MWYWCQDIQTKERSTYTDRGIRHKFTEELHGTFYLEEEG